MLLRDVTTDQKKRKSANKITFCHWFYV